MLPRDRGTIVEVGSALAYRGIPLQSAYCAAKHAVQGFTDSLHAELIHDESNVKLTMVQLPAVNTPQFDWVRSRLPNRAQPVPPIFQPEVPAKAIWWAAHHPRRELSVGYPTLLAIYVNKVAPGWLDHYLAWTGYSGQQTDEPEDPNRPDNLQGPLDDTVDHGTHGRFDDRSRDFAPALWANTHRPTIALTVGTVVAAALAMTRMTSRR
jgi:hypothetical protein